ncbi:MAG: DUF512 domain-containing protein [Atopobiaceae bacterium]|nr:DUF512 domain-containing protein [Atopobiaceae bacterium]
MSDFERADYAPSVAPRLGAWVASVEDGSPAWAAGIEPGMRIERVEGMVPRDLIDWMWHSDGPTLALEVFDPRDDTTTETLLERDFGQDWGIEFEDVLFDGIMTCKNACVFCFMAMLPAHMRDSLYLRDDDYRLSFLQGNFVTLTNLDDRDVERICNLKLEPMNVSLHAISPEARRRMIGAKEARGIEGLEQLIAAGIEIHAQIVLCPDINDGDELRHTLDWIEARPAISSLAIVPLGYTKHTKRFERSFSEMPERAREVLEIIQPYQQRSRERTGLTRFQLSDEFYLAAQADPPAAEFYDGYPQFYDGIGMLRSFLDELTDTTQNKKDQIDELVDALSSSSSQLLLVCGYAALTVFECFVESLGLSEWARAYPIKNDFFGGNVNVTGLIVAQDLFAQLPDELENHVVILPDVMFNSDMLTLDGVSLDAIKHELASRGATTALSLPTPEALLNCLCNSFISM